MKGGRSLKDALDAHLAELPPARTGDQRSRRQEGGDKKDKARPRRRRTTTTGRPHGPRTTRTAPPSRRPCPSTSTATPSPACASRRSRQDAFALEKPGDAPGDAIPFDAGYVAIQLKEKTPATKEEWDENKRVLPERDARGEGQRRADRLRKRLREQPGADVKFTTALVEDKPGKPGEQRAARCDDERVSSLRCSPTTI